MDITLSHASDLNFSFSSSGQASTPKAPVILAVDDDDDNLLLLTYALEPLDCTILTAADGQTALEMARSQQPDLILLDIMLHPIDGIQIVSQIKQDPRTMKIPVVAVTALARSEDKERILGAGCNDYISKPYMIEDMEALIRQYLGGIPSGDKALARDVA